MEEVIQEHVNKNLVVGSERQKLKEEAIKKNKEELEEVSAVFNRIFLSRDGKVLGQWLMEQCGFFEHSAVMTQHGISLESTLYNEARRSIYLELRKYFDSNTLINLEIKG